VSLRLRITLLVVLVVCAVVTAVGQRTHAAAETELIEEVDLELVSRARGVLDGPGRSFRDRDVRGLFGDDRAPSVAPTPDRAFLGAVEREVWARLIGPDGDVVVEFGDSFEASIDSGSLPGRGEPPVVTDVSVDGGRGRVATVPLGDDLFVQVARPLGEIDQSLDDLRIRILVIGAVSVVVAGAVAWFLAGSAVEPIRRLTAASESVAETGDFDHPVDGAGGAEVGRLAASFNTMLAALGASRRQQHQLVMDASHELRTPLASLQTNVDVLRSRPDLDPETRDAIVDDVHAEVGELSALVAELVDLATDVGEDEAVAPVELAALAEPIVERAQRRGTHTVTLDTVERAVVEARPHGVSRAIRNLVENAMKFAPEGSAVRVVVDGGSVTVHDAGPGIPSDEQEAVFDRFHRVESTRTLPGSGLGLAIVRQVAEKHGGSVSASESPDGGAAVGFAIPTVDD